MFHFARRIGLLVVVLELHPLSGSRTYAKRYGSDSPGCSGFTLYWCWCWVKSLIRSSNAIQQSSYNAWQKKWSWSTTLWITATINRRKVAPWAEMNGDGVGAYDFSTPIASGGARSTFRNIWLGTAPPNEPVIWTHGADFVQRGHFPVWEEREYKPRSHAKLAASTPCPTVKAVGLRGRHVTTGVRQARVS